MPRLSGVRISTLEEREIIIGQYLSGLSAREIAGNTNLSERQIYRWVQRYRTEGIVASRCSPTKPRCTTQQQDAEIVQSARETFFTSSLKIKEELNLNCSRHTILSRLREAGIISRRAATKTLLTEENEARRKLLEEEISSSSKDEMISSENEGLNIKIENCTSEEETKDPLNAFNAAQGLEPQISFVNCTSNWNSGEDSDLVDNYSIVKTEEEIVSINEVAPHTCEICNATYDGLASYEVHLKDRHEMHNIIHTEDNPYKNDESTSIDGLKTHRRIHTGEKPYKCDECTSSFTLNSNLKKHKIIHTREKLYKCDECSLSFNYSVGLKTHKTMHTGEKSYKCIECTKSFTTSVGLKKHKIIHTGAKLHKCDECTSSFITNGNLKAHKRIHSGEKPYKCDECTSSFAQSGTLKRHKRVHTGQKPYKCECTSSFTTSDGLKIHKMTHTGEKQYKCNEFTSRLAENVSLKRHT